MRIKLYITILFLLLITGSPALSYIENCRIVYLDSNFVKRIDDGVNLEFLKSDTLTYSDSAVIKRIPIKNLKTIHFTAGSSSPKGMLTGAAIGFCVVLTAALTIGQGLSGHSPSGSSISVGAAILGSIFLGVPIGGIIGGAMEGNRQEFKTFDFSQLSLKQSRQKLKNIFRIYSNT